MALDFLTNTQDGITVTTGAVSARVSVPLDSSGAIPKYIRVAATAESYVRLGSAAVVATTNSVLVQPSDSVVLSTNGAAYIAHIQGSSSAKVSVVPLENS